MTIHNLARDLRDRFGADRVHVDVPLAPLTTFKVGGPADLLLHLRSVEEAANALSMAARAGAPVRVIGGGSNLLVGDGGVRGLVIRLDLATIEPRSAYQVRAGAGATINGLVRWMVGRGLAGLEAWAGTPGTVGGAVYGNAHFGGHNVGEVVEEVGLLSPSGEFRAVPRAAMEFAYDSSRLQRTGEIVVWADFAAGPGEVAVLRAKARASLAHRKQTQPLASQSAGCVFQNPDPDRDGLPPGIPASAGALIDGAGLKGRRHGGAVISSLHANFIVNTGTATAADILALMTLARDAVRERFGVVLRDEIARIGEPC